MDTVTTRKYLQDALSAVQKEAESMSGTLAWLPEEIIDVHAHCNLPEHVLEISQEIYNHPISTFPSFTLEDSHEMIRRMYPGKRVRTIRFANAWKGIDHKAANDYLVRESTSVDRVALYGIPTDEEYTINALASGRFAALKCYPAFLNPPAQKIYQYFTPVILRETERMGIPIILHLPSIITGCVDDLKNLLSDFPHLVVILAHLGLPLLPAPGLQNAYAEVAKCRRVFMDTSIVPSAEVMEIAISEFGPDRILYGSDEPLNLIRAKAYENPLLGQRFAVEYPYHWVCPEEQARYGYLAKGCTSLHWQTLEALRTALEKLFSQGFLAKAKEMIFYANAKKVFRF